MTDSTGQIIATSENGKTLDGLLAELKADKENDEGDYPLSPIATRPSDYGSTVTDETADDFIIRHPQPTVVVDKYENPTSMTGTQKIKDATLTWVITDKDGNEVAKGESADVPADEIAKLPDGSYEVTYNETSSEEEVAIAVFIINHPVDQKNPIIATKPLSPGKPSIPNIQTGPLAYQHRQISYRQVRLIMAKLPYLKQVMRTVS